MFKIFGHRNIILEEVVPRGFLSNYTTILASFRLLMSKHGISPDTIFVAPTMFSLYGHPSNWFALDRIATTQVGKRFNSMNSCRFGARPTMEQLNFGIYRKIFPYNSRIESLLENSLKHFRKTLGVHYRGTDYHHTERKHLAVYLEMLSKLYKTGLFEQIFIATDEESITEQIVDYFRKTHKFENIIYN